MSEPRASTGQHVHELLHTAACAVFDGDYPCDCHEDARCPKCVERECLLSYVQAEIRRLNALPDIIAALKGFGTLQRMSDDRQAAKMEVRDLRARLDAAREALRRYGSHLVICPYRGTYGPPRVPGLLCTCGLAAALEEPAP